MKLTAKKLKVLFLLIFAGLAILTITSNRHFANRTAASISGPPASRTGAPGEQNCTDCHSQNAGSGQFSIIAPAAYTPGQTYQIQVKHVTGDTTRKRWGFEMTSLAGNQMAGSFGNLGGTTRIRSGSVGGNNRDYIEQTTAGTFANQTGGATWTFNWTAPASDVGPVTLYAAGIQANNNGNEDGDQMYLANVAVQPMQTVVVHHVFSDFDGDGRADPSVFRPVSGIWYLNRSSGGFSAAQLGISTDHLVPADYDGDDKADIAVWREDAPMLAAFYILQSSDNTLRIEPFGQTGDNPSVVCDWDGDGRADPAVYRDAAVGSQSYFYYIGSSNNPGGNITYLPWGTTGDRPMRGDFDGDSKADLAVFRPSNATWYIRNSSNNQLRTEFWGLGSDKFVSADYDGDGKTDPAVFRNGVWYVKQSSNGQAAFYNWGLNTDILVPADYDGDGKADPAVYRGGIWYIRMSGSGSLSAQSFGSASDMAVPNSYVQ